MAKLFLNCLILFQTTSLPTTPIPRKIHHLRTVHPNVVGQNFHTDHRKVRKMKMYSQDFTNGQKFREFSFSHCILMASGREYNSLPVASGREWFCLVNSLPLGSGTIALSPNRAGDNKILTPQEVKFCPLRLRRAGQNFLPLGWEFYYHPSDWVRTLHSVMAINCTINLTQCENFRIFLHSDFTWNQYWRF